MENKSVGWLIIGIAAAMALIVWVFSYSLKKIVSTTCSHGPTCTMYDTMSAQYWLSLSIVGIILAIGIFILFSKPDEKIIIKRVVKKQTVKKLNLSGLDPFEKDIIGYIQKENGAVFQKTLMEKFEMGKVKTTRVLDKLEAKQLVERKRRGMNNIVVLKN